MPTIGAAPGDSAVPAHLARSRWRGCSSSRLGRGQLGWRRGVSGLVLVGGRQPIHSYDPVMAGPDGVAAVGGEGAAGPDALVTPADPMHLLAARHVPEPQVRIPPRTMRAAGGHRARRPPR